MKKKIAILGSTGSIGQSTLEVIKKDNKNFDIILLSANNNYKKLIQQAKQFKAKNVLIKNKIFYERVKKALKKKKTKVFSGDTSINNIISGKLDYTMSAVVGLAGLQPTIDAIKISNINLPEGFTLKQVDWPTLNTRSGKPGYRGQIEVDVELGVPSTLPLGDITVELESNWQVCSDKTGVCVRGNATLHASIQ